MLRCVRQAHEGIEQLKMNLKEEHDLKVDWMTAVYCNVSSCHPRCLKHTVPNVTIQMALCLQQYCSDRDFCMIVLLAHNACIHTIAASVGWLRPACQAIQWTRISHGLYFNC